VWPDGPSTIAAQGPDKAVERPCSVSVARELQRRKMAKEGLHDKRRGL
jgi:hypothetical protein